MALYRLCVRNGVGLPFVRVKYLHKLFNILKKGRPTPFLTHSLYKAISFPSGHHGRVILLWRDWKIQLLPVIKVKINSGKHIGNMRPCVVKMRLNLYGFPPQNP